MLSYFKTFIIDLDGTVWRWKELAPGAKSFLEALRKMGKQVLFVTNNTLLSTEELAERLRGFGVKVGKNEIVSSGLVIREFLTMNGGKVLVVGEGLKRELEGNVDIKERPPVDYVAIGHDLKFDYEKMKLVLKAVKKGARLLAAAKGRIFCVGRELWPGTGAIVKAIEFASGKEALLLGKPSDYMAELVELFVQSPRKETVVIGDELDSDIELARKCGYFSILIKTGVDREVKGKIKPNLVVDSFKELKKLL